MKRSVLALIITITAGLLGIYIGAIIHLEGYFGIVAAIAVMGFFIILAIEDKE